MSLKDIFNEEEMKIGSKVHQKLQFYIDKYSSLFSIDIEDIGLNAYYMYPCMFKDDFEEISDEEKVELAVFGILYYKYLITFDQKFDNETTADTWGLFCRSFFAQEAIKGLSKFLHPNEEEYFNIMDKYVKEYVNAIKLEEDCTGNCSYDYYATIMRGKSAIAKCFAAAMAVKSKKIDVLDRLNKSQDYFYEAFQLFDDFKDLKHDISIGKHTWITDNIDSSDEKLYTQLYKKNMIEVIFQKINYNCDKALALAGKSKGWFKNICLFKTKIQMVYRDIMSKKFIPSSICINKDYSKLSLNSLEENMRCYLENDYINNEFLQIYHNMNFLKEEGYVSKENQSGDTFSRTFLLNILRECNFEVTNGRTVCIYSKWAEELLDKETKIFKCGWSYFPELKELAPDIDTLSEVMRFSHAVNNDRLNNRINECIKFVIDNCINLDGSIDTWMLTKDNASDAEKYAREFAKERWKIRQDPEVTANFLYSLSFYKDKVKDYEKIIKKGLKYLLECRGENGFWSSSWYCGDMYGTYVCTRCFKKFTETDEIINSILTTVLSLFSYNGKCREEMALTDYFFAILIIIELCDSKYAENYKEKIVLILRKVIDYINIEIDKEIGFLPSSAFIKVAEIVYKNNGKEYKYDLTYESILITTALGLKCCNRIRTILEENYGEKI